MKDNLILIGYFCVAILLTIIGTLMLIATKRSIELLARLIRLDKFYQPSPLWGSASKAQWRFAGFLLTVMGLLFVGMPIYWLLHPASSNSPSPQPSQISVHQVDWALLGGLSLLFGTGVVLLVKPSAALWFGRRAMPYHKISEVDTPPRLLPVRLIGALIALTSILFVVKMILS